MERERGTAGQSVGRRTSRNNLFADSTQRQLLGKRKLWRQGKTGYLQLEKWQLHQKRSVRKLRFPLSVLDFRN